MKSRCHGRRDSQQELEAWEISSRKLQEEEKNVEIPDETSREKNNLGPSLVGDMDHYSSFRRACTYMGVQWQLRTLLMKRVVDSDRRWSCAVLMLLIHCD
jgi:hypothetical protein